MIPPNLTSQNIRAIVIALLPLALWLMLIGSLQSGSVRDIVSPGSKWILLQGLRATLPLMAASLAVIIMVFKMRRQPPVKVLFISPLGLAAVYALVGVVASLSSPDGLQALYWSVAYLSVPLVLWAIVWGPNSLDWISRLVNLNWLIIILASVALFAFGVFKLNLGSFVLNPNGWFDCGTQGWAAQSSNFIRSTGVGRYAAIAAIFALTRFWYPRWRYLWILFFLASLLLLLHSGARTAMLGFAVAAPVVALLLGGRNSIIGGIVVLAVLLPIVWATGIHEPFLQKCVLREWDPAGIDYLNIQTPISSPILSEDSAEVPAYSGFFTGTGRTQIWAAGWEFIKLSPWLGYGFYADRLVLGTHMHNSVLHAMIQTGFIGTIPFVGALLFGWYLLLSTLRNLHRIAATHKTLVIQAAGLLVFLSLRALPESTGAFFGVDWLLLGPLLLYLRVVNSASNTEERSL